MDDQSKANIEAMTLRMFAVFFSILTLLIFVGTAFAKTTPTIVTSLLTGMALAAVAGSTYYASRRFDRR